MHTSRTSFRPRRAAAGLLAIALFAACGGSDIVTPSQNVTLRTATFGGFSADPAAADFTSVEAGTGPGTVRAHGTMKLPAPCHVMSARVSSNGAFIIVEVIAERSAAGCAAQSTQVAYDITAQGASAGRHTVVVRHEVDDGRVLSIVDVASTDVVAQ